MSHILLIPSWYPATEADVVGSFFREQAIALEKHGFRVGVVAPRALSLRKPRTWRNASRSISVSVDNGIPTYRQTAIDYLSPLPLFGPRQWISRGLAIYRDYVRSWGNPDVLHAHCVFNGGLLAARISAETGIPYVITEHSTAFARKLVSRRQAVSALPTIRGAKARMAVSEPFVELLNDFFGADSPGWTYVPNIVDERFFTGQISTGRKKSGTYQFASVGLMTPKKGQDVLLRAFAKAFRGDAEVALLLGGDGPMLHDLRSLARALFVESQVRFVGRLARQEIKDLLASSDAFVLPSLVETFGVVAAEALALGVPVIATRSGGPESIVGAGDGILVPPGDEDALAQAMADIKTGEIEFDAQEIRSRCHARFSGSSIAHCLAGIYEHAMQQGGAV